MPVVHLATARAQWTPRKVRRIHSRTRGPRVASPCGGAAAAPEPQAAMEIGWRTPPTRASTSAAADRLPKWVPAQPHAADGQPPQLGRSMAGQGSPPRRPSRPFVTQMLPPASCRPVWLCLSSCELRVTQPDGCAGVVAAVARRCGDAFAPLAAPGCAGRGPTSPARIPWARGLALGIGGDHQGLCRPFHPTHGQLSASEAIHDFLAKNPFSGVPVTGMRCYLCGTAGSATGAGLPS